MTTSKTLKPATFAPQTTFEVGDYPYSVSVGDVNGDGNADVVAANWGSNNVSVLLGDGRGGFAAQTTFAVGTNPLSVSVADVNGDGNADVVAANWGSNNVSVLLGDGRGGFAAQTTFAVGDYPLSVSVSDVNGDGNADVVAANRDSNNVSVLLGDGRGGFAAQTTFEVGSDPNSVSVSDVNGDGNADVVAANWGSNNVSVLLGDGRGGFAAQTTFAVGTNPLSVSVADVNGDGNADVVAANRDSNNVSVLLGDGRGDFAAQTTFAVGNQPKAISVSDVNGDGYADLITANDSSDTISILQGDGTGKNFTHSELPISGLWSYSVGVADFNNDGKSDLVAARGDAGSSVAVLLNTTEGKFAASSNPIAPPSYKLTVQPNANENGSSAFVLTTKNVAAGTEIPFDLSGTISDADVLGGLSTHSFVIEDDGTATLPIKYIEDKKTEGNETLTVTLHDKKEVKATVTVKDTSIAPVIVSHPVTGNVVISGVATEGETLTIQNTLKDADGLGAFNYQWLQNGKVISGATQANYVLQASDIGKTLKAKISYTDKIGTLESVTSSATDFVEAKPVEPEPTVIIDVIIDAPIEIINHKPTGAIKIVGNAIEKQVLTLANTLNDSDGLGAFSVSWLRDGKIISGATQNSYTLTATDIGKKISAAVSYTDKLGFAEKVSSSATSAVVKTANAGNIDIGKHSGVTFNGTVANEKRLGTERDDYLSGGAGADTFKGGAGNDTLDGGTGDDYLDGENGNDVLTGGEGKDILIGGSGEDKITGGKENDSLTGENGNDTLDGGEGVDTMAGGLGDDYYVVDHLKDIVKETEKNIKTGGNDTVESNQTYTLGDNLENLILSGISEINGTGNKANNRIEGNIANNLLSGNTGNDYLIGGEGDDTLDGGSGADTLEGGAGNDIYKMNNVEDKIIEVANNEDQDQVIATVSYDLSQSPDLEMLTLSGKDATKGVGNTANNFLQETDGGTIANYFDGMEGNDTIIAEGGNDTLVGGDGNDSLDGGDGNDTVVFDGAFDEYQFSRNPDTDGVDEITVEYISFENESKIGERDILTSIELVQFADGDVHNVRDIETIVTGSSALLILNGIEAFPA